VFILLSVVTHLLEGVSGSIEGDESPLHCALREVEEETGLQRNRGDIRLIRSGRPLKVTNKICNEV
jgi:8-oxo-dGTP pyrophosphatase MutT (NUDIX family)